MLVKILVLLTSCNFFLFFFTERAFVHEWAKYRYGVFEEIGFENDPIYPTSYYGEENYGSRGGSSSSSEKRPTSCTNKPLQGSWYGYMLNPLKNILVKHTRVEYTYTQLTIIPILFCSNYKWYTSVYKKKMNATTPCHSATRIYKTTGKSHQD